MDIQKSELPSGLSVISAHMPGFSTTTVAAVSKTGACAERDEEHGIAHFLEHMAFKGTRKRSMLDISREAEMLGSDMNAFTGSEMTAYHITGLGRHTEAHASILGDILTNSIFARADIDTECGVIQQEIKKYEDAPGSVCFDALDFLTWRDHRLGRNILGTAESVASFGTDDFLGFIRRNYTTENLFVISAGDMQHERLVAMAAEHFGGVEAPNEPVLRPGKPTFHSGVKIIRDKFKQVTIGLALEAVGLDSPKRHAFRLLCGALGGGMSSPIFQEVREKRGLAYSVGAHADLDPFSGRLIINAGTTAEHVEEVIRVSLAELVRIATEGVTSDDFTRARNSDLVSLATAKEKPTAMTFSLARWYAQTGELRTPEHVMAEIEAVTPEDVRAMAQEIIAGKPAALSLVGPVLDADYAAVMESALR